ncbi:UNVERIFIED_CONTAM: AP-1 complex subunit mu-2 [Sesamum radiatum]|uniref:AP-1 complex subunit mu-2 n=1 Tax=Sesamum radiatum TaxID=300843 RepID=A0AAW2QHZ9_SESRA
MTASRQNCNVASLLFFLHRCLDVFKHYFDELEEESLRDNFVVVYELLDESWTLAILNNTEAKILSEFIKTDAYKMEGPQRPPMAVTNAVSWRSEGVVYRTNEVFLDVVESVNILVNSNGQIIRSEVYGALKMRTRLSGMPECKLGLNDRVPVGGSDRSTKGKAIDLDDVKFTLVERYSRSRVEMTVKAKSQFKERRYNFSTSSFTIRFLLHCDKCGQLKLPVPSDATNPSIRTSMGTAKYAPETDAVLWKIKSFPGNKEYMLRAEFRLPSIISEDAAADRKAPIRVKFEIPYFTVSGIQVRYLKIIEKSGYQALPWVRYITMAGDYEVRLI